ncbi:MAG TPA: hypothetical protein VL088_14680 [Pedobacter sp.]|nr:hypothetical protein [Pedobacter sp.]
MISEKLKQLIQLLTDKTKNKKAIWNKVSGNNQFKLSISEGVSITINEWGDQYQDSYEVVIFNSNGDAIQRYMSDNSTPPEDFEILQVFHKAASDQYFKVDETMDALLSSITGQEVIGKADTYVPPVDLNAGEEDDLPF